VVDVDLIFVIWVKFSTVTYTADWKLGISR